MHNGHSRQVCIDCSLFRPQRRLSNGECQTFQWQSDDGALPRLAGSDRESTRNRAGGDDVARLETLAGDLIQPANEMEQRRDRSVENVHALPTVDLAAIANEVAELYEPLVEDAGFIVMKGNLFDSAIMKTSVISDEFRGRYLSNPQSPNAFEGRAIVFEGPEDYHHRIDDPALEIDENCMLFIRGAGPIGYPGGAEVVNMQPPAALLKRGIHSLPCIGDGRQSGTSGSPSILNASPEAAAGGGLALVKTGDRIRIDLNKGEANILISTEELNERRAALQAGGGFPIPKSQTPWQEIQRGIVDQFAEGMVLKPATKYQHVARTMGVPRDNH